MCLKQCHGYYDRKRLARVREQEGRTLIREEAEEGPQEGRGAPLVIFEKMGARTPGQGRGRERTASQRQHIFQVLGALVRLVLMTHSIMCHLAICWAAQFCHCSSVVSETPSSSDR